MTGRARRPRELAAAETRLFIDGDYRDAVAGGRFESINPAYRDMPGTCPGQVRGEHTGLYAKQVSVVAIV